MHKTQTDLELDYELYRLERDRKLAEEKTLRQQREERQIERQNEQARKIERANRAEAEQQQFIGAFEELKAVSSGSDFEKFIAKFEFLIIKLNSDMAAKKKLDGWGTCSSNYMYQALLEYLLQQKRGLFETPAQEHVRRCKNERVCL